MSEMGKPRNELDLTEALFQIWQSVLGTPEPPTPTSNLLDLGGTSLIAVQIRNRIRNLCGIQLSMHEFFSDPTPDGIVSAVISRLGNG